MAAGLVKVNKEDILGIIGSGEQAKLQAIWIAHYLGITKIRIWARKSSKALALAAELNSCGLTCSVSQNRVQLCKESRIVVTTTPSTMPVLMSEHIVNETHIIALGADSPGKQELDPTILKRAKYIVTDDHNQCLDHGEFGVACRTQTISSDSDYALGALLSEGKQLELQAGDISVVDLTGLGVQDLAIASLINSKI